MSKENNEKELFLSLYNQLTYDYQLIVLNTFKCLASYNDLPEKGYQPYAISDVINYYQKKKDYTNQEVCDKASELVSTTENYISLPIGTYTKNKQRNSQAYKKGINWLNVIAEVLDFAYEEYHKYLTDEGLQRSHELITKYSYAVNSIETLYDFLSTKEKTAMHQLTLSLLNLYNAKDNE